MNGDLLLKIFRGFVATALTATLGIGGYIGVNVLNSVNSSHDAIIAIQEDTKKNDGRFDGIDKILSDHQNALSDLKASVSNIEGYLYAKGDYKGTR